MRLRLSIAYDGTPFAGWQSQANGEAVQDILEARVQKITGFRVPIHGSGRTDAGVHALAQTAHLDVPDNSLKPAEWQRALNAQLPATIRIMKAQRAPEDFHARFSAKGKIYRYLISNAPVLPPHQVDRVWHSPRPLDLAALEEAAGIFVGHHDFAAFAANRGTPVADTCRTIRRISLTKSRGLISLTFEGDGFLYKMVRMLTGAIVRVSQGKEEMSLLASRLRGTAPKWTHVAPAGGLYLVKVLY